MKQTPDLDFAGQNTLANLKNLILDVLKLFCYDNFLIFCISYSELLL